MSVSEEAAVLSAGSEAVVFPSFTASCETPAETSSEAPAAVPASGSDPDPFPGFPAAVPFSSKLSELSSFSAFWFSVIPRVNPQNF